MLAVNLLNMVVVYQVFFARTGNNFMMDASYRAWKLPVFFVLYAIIFAIEMVFFFQMTDEAKFYAPLSALDMSMQGFMFLQVFY